MSRLQKIGCVASDAELARRKLAYYLKRYGWVDMVATGNHEVDLVVALGGDGFMLRALHDYKDTGAKFYGVNCGTVGFLMNDRDDDLLQDNIEQAVETRFQPLLMTAVSVTGESYTRLAFNEVSLLRETHQSAKIRISIDGAVRLQELVGDGVLVATPAGSTAYNMAVQGPIIPLDARLLALTPISPFKPRNWRGALLPQTSTVEFEVLKPERRPVSAVADYFEIRDVAKVKVCEYPQASVTVLFNANHSLEERVIKEQFML
ncbi:MAG: NAD kinase [Alphaproteobacteria bacterium]|nr:NAD kinase [Alphaproteobacteria bacterium]